MYGFELTSTQELSLIGFGSVGLCSMVERVGSTNVHPERRELLPSYLSRLVNYVSRCAQVSHNGSCPHPRSCLISVQ